MNQEQRQAYEWAKNQNYQSVAARYAKILAELVDEITPPNEPLTLEQCKQKKYIWFDSLNDWAKVTNYGVLFFGTEDYRTWEELKENGFGEKYRAYCHPPEGEV